MWPHKGSAEHLSSEDELLSLLAYQDLMDGEDEQQLDLQFLNDLVEEDQLLIGHPEDGVGMPGPTTSKSHQDPLAYRIGLSSGDKAGMQSVDKDKTNKIIYELSKVPPISFSFTITPG